MLFRSVLRGNSRALVALMENHYSCHKRGADVVMIHLGGLNHLFVGKGASSGPDPIAAQLRRGPI